MRTLIATFAAAVAFAVAALAWTPVEVNDTGSLNDDGLHRWVYRGHYMLPHDFSSRTSLFGRESKFFIHFLRPAEAMETVMIGDLRFSEFLPPCADEDTLRGRFEMAFSFRVDEVDTNDWNTEPVWTSPSIGIPFVGYTPRYFFSSLSRTQGNAWDQMVTQINSIFLPGDPIIIRFIPEGESGFLINDEAQPFSLAYTTDLTQEPAFLDIGDTRIRYLSAAERPSFHGLVIHGTATRDPWTSQRALFRFFSSGGAEVTTKEVAVPWLEDQTRKTVYLGLTPEFVAQHPSLTFYANGRPEEEPTTCRVDTLKSYYQR